MAAELERLIAQFRQHGFTAAASHLSVLKAGLEAHGLIPPRLGDAPTDPAERTRRVEISSSGHVRIGQQPLDLKQSHELDMLEVSVRQRNALLKSGFSSIADVQYGIEHHLLPLVRHISRRSAREIEDKLRQTLPRRSPARNGSE